MNTYLYKEMCPEAVNYLYKEVVIEGWSMLYACRRIKGGIKAVKRNFTAYPVLIEIYDYYIYKKKNKPQFGYRNI